MFSLTYISYLFISIQLQFENVLQVTKLQHIMNAVFEVGICNKLKISEDNCFIINKVYWLVNFKYWEANNIKTESELDDLTTKAQKLGK